jgi:large conductance mechanosensitive channel
MLKEFKEFATRGNIMDLAVGVIIGGAFQKIVNSLVSDIIMPFISIITGKVDFSDMVLTIGSATISYGNFITEIVNFLIIAFSIFLFVKYLNSMNKKLEKIKFGELEKITEKLDKNGKLKKKKEKPAPEPTSKICPFCLSEINIKASRCPHCTSILEEDNKEEIAGEQLTTEE